MSTQEFLSTQVVLADPAQLQQPFDALQALVQGCVPLCFSLQLINQVAYMPCKSCRQTSLATSMLEALRFGIASLFDKSGIKIPAYYRMRHSGDKPPPFRRYTSLLAV
jgi:hypothetical protein